MTDTEIIVSHRQKLIDGLKEYVEFLEAHSELPFGKWSEPQMSLMLFANEDEITSVAKASGGWDKSYDTNYLSLVREFGPVTLTVYCSREDICTPKETKTEIVEEPDADWLRAEIAKLKDNQPVRTVEKTTVLEWNCRPLLGKDDQ